MRSLDTNVVLRLLLQDSPEQAARVAKLFAASKPNSLVVADAVFFEVAWVLAGPAYRLSREVVAAALQQIAAIPQVSCNRPLIERAVPLYRQHAQLSFIDICLAVHAELNGATPLLSFDRALARQLPATVESLLP